MSLADTVLAVMWVAVTLYAVFAGADFGAGFWDLVAGGARGGASQRRLIEHSIAPVWEANHVWLIFILVVLWTGFPVAFASIMAVLYIPLTAAAVGVILRGAGFAFRKSVDGLRMRRLFGAAFAASSVLTPFFLGAAVGAVASGRVPIEPAEIDPFDAWLHPTSMLAGTLAVASSAYLAAAFLAADAARQHQRSLAERYRRLGALSALATGVVALAGIVILHADAPRLYEGLIGRGLPLILASAVAGLSSVGLLILGRYRPARVAAVIAVVAVVWGWAAAQYPQLLVGELTIDEAAGSRATLTAMLASLAVGSVLFVPPLIALLVIHARGGLTSDGPERPASLHQPKAS
ncbi:MAG: cytochrome d ubiquinol oxidase subunit II [Actinomycetota bacterium]|nr:cytochrome d ubiquinol oxidase subunit II [Actinomycetota bacterium]